MNLSEIAGKEIVNLVTGERLGVIGECDLILDETTGDILALLIPKEKGFFGIKKDKSVLEVPWRNIKKIGNDMIIIEHEGIY
ncbi:YlmC/YmxH family sporulation protein [Asaccharospora irregularis]|uniref:Sporulation protein, YlmC/YmxH family n=1 Tax=Asaccharospora irregularis DSM 2635 TaxID=1121321 RepID=A0A1M5NLF4_9FIRM|nr:YlmC/YmxH family sporulation protein [Asaccharospora irregularis]SHG90342.1 sporulation protein, YlmC/YmxH family [Asaccharospora irregularis DSM 2635]